MRVPVVTDSVSRMLGEDEDTVSALDDKSIFPDEAETLPGGQGDAGDNPKSVKPSQVGFDEPLINPSVALVAPDVTPNLFAPLEPSMAPKPTQVSQPPVLSTILARPSTPAPPSPVSSSAQVSSQQSATAESLRQLGISPDQIPGVRVSTNESEMAELRRLQNMSYDPVAAATTAGIPMPEHVVNPDAARQLIDSTRHLLRV